MNIISKIILLIAAIVSFSFIVYHTVMVVLPQLLVGRYDSDGMISSSLPSPTSLPVSTPTPLIVPVRYEIPLKKQVFQTFNNCGPASLSMLLSYYDIEVSQETLGTMLRPYQVKGGDNDDKSVTVYELADTSREYSLIPYYRPNGSIQLLKQFISLGYPVLVRTWLNPDDDIGHYRIIRGYDDTTNIFIQDDSYHGKQIAVPYAIFEQIWKPFHYEFLVLFKTEDEQSQLQSRGLIHSTDVSWEKMFERAKTEYELGGSPYSVFTMSVASFHMKQYQDSIRLYEESRPLLPRRMLWYQTEPIEAYLAVGDSEQVVRLTQDILSDENRAFSELYILRAYAYLQLNDLAKAKMSVEQAVLYNKNLTIPYDLQVLNK